VQMPDSNSQWASRRLVRGEAMTGWIDAHPAECTHCGNG